MDRRRRATTAEPGVDAARRAAFYADVHAGRLTVAQTVRAMRQLTRLTQPEYARLVGVAPRVLIDIERGVANPTVATLEKIARPFGLRVGLVFRAAEPEEPRE